MKLTFLSKSVRTIGLITLLSAIQGMSMVQTVQARPKPQAQPVCSVAYFDDPGYMYQPATQQQQEAIDKYSTDPIRVKKFESFIDEATTFSAPLDSPMGFSVKKVNGKNVPIPDKIRRAMERAVLVDPSQNSRKRVAELNQKYGQYATFGQNITLILSPEKTKEYSNMVYEFLAYISSNMTPQQRQAERDERIAAGECSPGAIFKANGPMTFTVDTGRRPELDKIVREDKTGRTLFKL
jgi:hypothetical protein